MFLFSFVVSEMSNYLMQIFKSCFYNIDTSFLLVINHEEKKTLVSFIICLALKIV